jgi:flagellar hook assembly protein FlgD
MKDFKKSDGRVGIMLSSSVVSDKVEMTLRLENNERVAQTKVVIYDNVGNMVFEAVTREDKLVWDLRNSVGRNVANGSYLIVAQVRGSSGKTWGYSAKLGVRRR